MRTLVRSLFLCFSLAVCACDDGESSPVPAPTPSPTPEAQTDTTVPAASVTTEREIVTLDGELLNCETFNNIMLIRCSVNEAVLAEVQAQFSEFSVDYIMNCKGVGQGFGLKTDTQVFPLHLQESPDVQNVRVYGFGPLLFSDLYPEETARFNPFEGCQISIESVTVTPTSSLTPPTN